MKKLKAAFRHWLDQSTTRRAAAKDYDALRKRLKHVQAGRRFTRAEMNER